MNSFNYVIKEWKAAGKEKKFDVIIKHLRTLYRNRELVSLMSELMDQIPNFNEKEFYLLFLRKAILQVQRKPDPEHFKAFEDEYLQELEEISQEQLEHAPLKWIEAELEFVRHAKELNLRDVVIPQTETSPVNSKKDWLTFPEVMDIFHLSKSSLRKRIAEGMPVSKLGTRLMFNQDLVYDWVIKGED
jgi:hypothetical protein